MHGASEDRPRAWNIHAATVAIAAGHAATLALWRSPCHPTWDRLLDRIGQGLEYGDKGEMQLRWWIHDLVLSPKTPQPALLLTGPECSGKHTFHEAMKLLLPDRSVIYYSQHGSGNWTDMMQRAWLMVIEGHPERFVGLFRHNRYIKNRYLKWCLTHTQSVDPMPDVQHFDLQVLGTTSPQSDLIRQLAKERWAFRQTLTRYRGVA